MGSEFAIELTNINKSYAEAGQEHCIFRNLNLVVPHGEFLVLLGRSGSGKSTLLNLISGIDLPNWGDIVIGGLKLSNLSEKKRTIFRRKHIGFIFQAYNLIPTLTVRENLILPLEINKIRRKFHDNKIRTLLKEIALENRENAFPDRLSGGEQQRVAVARAVVHDPEIILADEPTGNLDLETGQIILNLLNRCVQSGGKTLIMATHSEEVLGRAKRILSIRHCGLSHFESSHASKMHSVRAHISG